MHSYHTQFGTLTASAGESAPFGATVQPAGINFAIASAHATDARLVLFGKGEPEPFVEIPFLQKTGHVFHIQISGIAADRLEYGFRFDGPNEPENGHYFDPDRFLFDPYARALTGRSRWRQPEYPDSAYPMRSAIPVSQFNWDGDRPLNLPAEDLIIYEMHTHAFTAHPSADVAHPGTYAAITEKIPYFKELGVNCIELLPIQEFDEFESPFTNPETGERLFQYWGYGTTGFYAPKAGYGVSDDGVSHLDELKTLIKTAHRAGIEVWLDVVFNHTAEGNEQGHTLSFRGIDNKTWYMLADDDHHFLNYSGTGNTLNCNHPSVAQMIVDCLRYWVTEFHIDGFRFDLASVFTRGQDGKPMARPPVVEMMATDPVLANTKLVAEAWDAAGLYQVGTFPHFQRWGEWNGRYRDNVRRFLIGAQGQTGGMVQRILGSPDLYKKGGRTATASINFITCHDGFALRDVFSYDHKRNLANGEDNRDGENNNNSWNCGHEGETDDGDVLAVRHKMVRNALAILLLSRGVPLLNMGDELWHTKRGNNNTWGHDSDLNWLNWDQLKNDQTSADLFRFTRLMVEWRKRFSALRITHFPGEAYQNEPDPADICWHGISPFHPDWSWNSHTLAFSFPGDFADGSDEVDQDEMAQDERPTVYVAMNMHWEDHAFTLPPLAEGLAWHELVNTARPAPDDIRAPGDERPIGDAETILVKQRSVTVLLGR